MATPLKVGVISDTHGLVRAEALEALRGVDVIVHAGDVGGSHVLAGARRARPGDRGARQRGPRALGAGAARTGAASTWAGPRSSSSTTGPRWGPTPPGKGIRVVVFGHSHQPLAEQDGPVLWFNPGSAGPRAVPAARCPSAFWRSRTGG